MKRILTLLLVAVVSFFLWLVVLDFVYPLKPQGRPLPQEQPRRPQPKERPRKLTPQEQRESLDQKTAKGKG